MDTVAPGRKAGSGGSRTALSSLNDIPGVARYLRRIGAQPRNFRTADIRTGDKYQRVIARLAFSAEGEVSLVSGDAELPDPGEAAAIKHAFEGVEFPTSQPFLYTAKHLPQNDDRVPWSKADPDKLYVCWDRARQEILFVQERIDLPDGSKFYIPWSYWSDGQWRKMEPDGKLPLSGLEQLDTAGVVCLHEGAKASLAVRRLLEDPVALAAHPYGQDLLHMTHLGWLGGAMRPQDTDWSPLSGVRLVYVMADNDPEGQSVIPQISKALSAWPVTVIAVRPDDRFPLGFDLADELPHDAPPFMDLCCPATWATGVSPSGDPYLRKEWERGWWMVAGEGDPLFINRFDRSRLFTEKGFNTAVRALSDTPNTCDLFKRSAYAQHVAAIAYEPGDKEGVVIVEADRCINTWTAPRLRPVEDDPKLWLDFADHLIPHAEDRQRVLKWCATLIARPRNRMHYGLLLSSTVQGVGKTTLCEILRVLVGEKNCRSPSAHDVVESQFNSWIVRKRLVIVNEIYEGGKWNAYNKIKSKITDLHIDANEKMIRSYSVRNWAHFILCSNAEVPLWIEDDDRRFLVPEVTEVTRDKTEWDALHAWLGSGGYGIIAGWADRFVEEHGAVQPGEHAPDSARKRALIEDSRSSEEQMVRSIATEARDRGGQVILVENDVLGWLESRSGRQFKPSTVRGWLKKAGLCVSRERLKVEGQMTRVAGVMPVDGSEGWPALKPYRATPENLEGI